MAKPKLGYYISPMNLPLKHGKSPKGPIQTKGQAIYVLSIPSGYFKVGRSKNPIARMALFQCGCPEKISLYGATPYGTWGVCPVEFERRIHDLLDAYRITGEWFLVPEDTLASAIKVAWTSIVYPDTISRWERMREYMRRRRAKT